jgi:DNA-binding response OmpR family regulator
MASLAGASPVRVLVVDDHEDGAEGMALVMKLSGHEVAIVRDAERVVAEALRLASELILLDLALEGPVDGYEVARRLRSASFAVRPRLVAITGFTSDGDRQRAREVGFDLYLVKPVDPALLRDLARVVQSRRSAPE